MSDSSTLAMLRIILGADTSDLDSGLKNAGNQVLRFGKGVQNMSGELFNLRNAFAVVAGVAAVDFVKRMAEAGDEIAKTAQKIGITTDSLQELRYAASLSGTKAEDFDAALLQLNKRIGEVNGGVTEAMVTLGKLGFTFADIKGKGTDVVFKLIADRIGLIRDPMERARISTELFGKAGQQLLGTMANGSAGLADMGAEAHKLGLVLSAETLKKAEEANGEFTKIGNALKVAGINIAVGFLPALEDLRKHVTAQDFQDGVKNLATNFGTLITWIVDHKSEIAYAASAFAGMRLGMSFGAAFGPQAGAAGGVIGAVLGLGAAAQATRPEIEKATSALTLYQIERDNLAKKRDATGNDDQIQSLTLQIDKLDAKIAGAKTQLEALKNSAAQPSPAATAITVTPGAGGIETQFPQIDQAVNDLSLKTRILRNDFANLAPNFVETGTALKVFGDALLPNAMNSGQLSGQLQMLNQALLAFAGAQLTQQVMPAWQLYEQQIQRINLLYQNGAIGADTYQRAMRDAAVKSGTAWDVSGASIAGSFATIAGSFGKSSGAMATAAKGFAIVQATLSVYTGMTKALELPFPANLAAAAQVAAQGFAFVANIKSQAVPKFATGGSFRVGGAGGLDTKRVAMDLNPGEIVDVRPPQYGEGGGAGAGARSITVVLQGENFSRPYLAKMIEGFNEMAKDGYRLKVAPT